MPLPVIRPSSQFPAGCELTKPRSGTGSEPSPTTEVDEEVQEVNEKSAQNTAEKVINIRMSVQ